MAPEEGRKDAGSTPTQNPDAQQCESSADREHRRIASRRAEERAQGSQPQRLTSPRSAGVRSSSAVGATTRMRGWRFSRPSGAELLVAVKTNSEKHHDRKSLTARSDNHRERRTLQDLDLNPLRNRDCGVSLLVRNKLQERRPPVRDCSLGILCRRRLTGQRDDRERTARNRHLREQHAWCDRSSDNLPRLRGPLPAHRLSHRIAASELRVKFGQALVSAWVWSRFGRPGGENRPAVREPGLRQQEQALALPHFRRPVRSRPEKHGRMIETPVRKPAALLLRTAARTVARLLRKDSDP